MKISVIMSTYNEGDGTQLKQAVDSILQQTFGEFEFIICDDGSTDNTWKVLKKMQALDQRIKIIHNRENKKAGFARNTAIQQAHGEYIAIMDSDDIAHKERLKKQAEYLDKHQQYAFLGTQGEFFVDAVGDDGECYMFIESPEPKDFLFNLPFVHASIMIRREVLQQVRGYDCSKKVVRAEDYDLLLRIYGEGYRGRNLPEVLYYIRRNEKQYKRRKYRYRFHEAYIKYRGFKKLKLMPKGILYVIKPLIVGLIPIPLMKVIQKKYYYRKQ
ncbi:MAG: glycosyltransferase [Roseburia sp. 1XD42-69]